LIHITNQELLLSTLKKLHKKESQLKLLQLKLTKKLLL